MAWDAHKLLRPLAVVKKTVFSRLVFRKGLKRMKQRAFKKLFSKRRGVKRSRDDRGFTLLELIIAMAIFAVITIPIMNMFSKSAELNGKARRVQNTNDAASSVAETVKALDLEKDLYLTGKNDSKTFNAAEAQTLANLFGDDVVAIGTPEIDSNGKLTFQLSNVPSGGRKFDAAITLDPAASDYFKERNKEKITSGQNVKQYYAESNTPGTTPYDRAVRESIPVDSRENIHSHSREIVIRFNLKTEGDNQVVTAKVFYIYKINYDRVFYDENTGTSWTTPDVAEWPKNFKTLTDDELDPYAVYSANILSFANSGNKEENPINFFLFYNPDYTGKGYPKDKITIENPNNLLGGVYIIKQKLEEEELEKKLDHSTENSYSAWIDLSEHHSSTGKMNLTIGTNINISHVDDTYGNKLSGNYLVRNKVSTTVVRTMEPKGDYIASSDYDRVYAYTVKVYDPTGAEHDGSETPVYEISGVRLR